ncbi:Platinum sensitivity protein [Agyrium rufum]|nr:Platinum sensitivity protein [Agyrium rufum]
MAMGQQQQHAVGPSEKKRVKVYELKEGDWFDRGTGFCSGQLNGNERMLVVEAEEDPSRRLLNATVSRGSGYQKQQDTLIIWTEAELDMALSFQEAEGCSAIWDFANVNQSQLGPPLNTEEGPMATDDALSDDALDNFSNHIALPTPDLGNLAEIDQIMRMASSTPQGRDALAKAILVDEIPRKLASLVEEAENRHALDSLHRLSNIMKMLILLNDNQIIEQVVSDDVVLGVVGALEYDQEFPHHKANHRQYLRDRKRYKEVVPIEDPMITRKIHNTWRLQYLKDVVLARILDDPTFSVLNSLIFFNQVDIVNHLHQNEAFLRELFSIISSPDADTQRKKDAVSFIQQCCAIAKNLQAHPRSVLYNNFVENGLLNVVTFALEHPDASIRTTGTDILVAMIDHDPSKVRQYIVEAPINRQKPLTDTLIELLLIESDLGIKAQVADAIKVLLDPQISPAQQEIVARQNPDLLSKMRGQPPNGNSVIDDFIQSFYDDAAKKLFQPLKNLEHRESVQDLTFREVLLFTYLIEILTFFIRQHMYRSKYFLLTEALAARITQLLSCPQKHLKLTALKFFRTCMGQQDDWYYNQLIQTRTFGPILDIVYDTMPRDNLLNSACLELFEYLKKESVKPMIDHLVENYRPKLEEITYVDTFHLIILKYDQMHNTNAGQLDATLFDPEDELSTLGVSANGRTNPAQRWGASRDLDAAEEEYFNTSDDEDELASARPTNTVAYMTNGSIHRSPLVDYPEDDDEEPTDMKARPPPLSDSLDKGATDSDDDESSTGDKDDHDGPPTPSPPGPPPERITEKRRREDDEEDELGKLTMNKRRSSSASATSSVASSTAQNSELNGTLTKGSSMTPLRRKKSFPNGRSESNSPGANGGKKISIALSVKTPVEAQTGTEG